MKELSCETIVGEKLVSWLSLNTSAQILSFHPPSSKAYSSDLIRIPKLSLGGFQSRDRNHVDIVFLTARNLWFVELKCAFSESVEDMRKLKSLKSSFTKEQIVQIIKNRITVPFSYPVEAIKDIRIAIGVKRLDSPFLGEMPIFVVDEGVKLVGILASDL